MEEGNQTLHVVMFPWLAMGHLIPFLQLSKHLAQKGHKVSFISTPANIQRLPKIPHHLAPLINLVAIPLPKIHGLPDHAESSMDLPREKQHFLKKAFDLLHAPVSHFLQQATPKPDWIIRDYASHWLPRTAASTAFFSLFNAATLAFFGPPSILLHEGDGRKTAESFTVVPAWIPFPSNITYRLHEVVEFFEDSFGDESVDPDTIRFAATIEGSDLVVIRTSVEFEPEWFDLVGELYKKPVVSLGVLPPSMEEEDEDDDGDEKWLRIKKWLDRQTEGKVVYVATGTEAALNQDEIREMGAGLEKSELPFFWVVRNPPPSSDMPVLDRINSNGVGIVCTEWVPQVKILGHPAVGAFLTHCGWNSVIEALGFGRVLVLFPVTNEQGLNARLLEGKKVGVEIPRMARDGLFTAAQVAETLRFAVVSEEGESLRANARKVGISLFGDRSRSQSCMHSFINRLEEGRKG